MVVRVTGRGRNSRAHLSARLRSPRSHVLTKLQGETITGSWAINNSGGQSGEAFMELWIPSLDAGWFGLPIVVPAGGSATATVSGPVTAAAAIYTCEAHAKVWPSPLGGLTGVLPGGVHDFTLTISAAIPASRFVVGSRVGWTPFTTQFIGTVTQTFWAGDRWEYFVVWDPGQVGDPQDTWIQEELLVPV